MTTSRSHEPEPSQGRAVGCVWVVAWSSSGSDPTSRSPPPIRDTLLPVAIHKVHNTHAALATSMAATTPATPGHSAPSWQGIHHQAPRAPLSRSGSPFSVHGALIRSCRVWGQHTQAHKHRPHSPITIPAAMAAARVHGFIGADSMEDGSLGNVSAHLLSRDHVRRRVEYRSCGTSSGWGSSRWLYLQGPCPPSRKHWRKALSKTTNDSGRLESLNGCGYKTGGMGLQTRPCPARCSHSLFQ
mmetsp:Transcript_111215/g.192919  ORF Transcript_111215/g.192919 Transcript_111215/m.192919 type:complete len:242 (-) Transcript_111215:1170-1895(-)